MTINNDKNIVKELLQLDFSKNEAEVWLALLEGGASNAKPIIDRTGLHRQFVYSALERLQERGFATYVVKNGRRVFQAEPPQRLIQAQKEREKRTNALIPKLLKATANSEDRLSVRTLRGVEEFRNNLITALEESARGDKILRVMGGGSGEKFYELIGNFYDTYRNVGHRLGIKKHLLASSFASEQFKSIFAQEPGTKLKLSPFLSSPTYTRITYTMVTIEVYASEPIIIQIWNKAIAQAYKEHFEVMWTRSEEFKSAPI